MFDLAPAVGRAALCQPRFTDRCVEAQRAESAWGVGTSCSVSDSVKPWPQHVPKAASAVLPAPAGLEGGLPETHPGQAPGSLEMDTFWRRPLQSSDF